MNKAIDRCPVCGRPVFLYQNQVFRGRPSGRIENAQDKPTLVDDNRYVFDTYECLNMFRKLKSVYGSNFRNLFSFFYYN
jgi:hypothetical protein